MIVRNTIDGERPQRPPKGKKLGLSDEFWEIIQSSLAHETQKRPPAETFVEFLEKTIQDVAMLKELAKFNASSEDDIQKLRKVFECGDNTLVGMQEDEALVVIEVFDRVGFLVRPSGWFQVLNSSLNNSKLRSRCLRGKVPARCGLLPKSYWISHSSLVEPDNDFSATGRVSRTCQRSIDGQLVAVKTISPDCVENVNASKHARLPPINVSHEVSLIDTVFRFGSSRNRAPIRSFGSD